MQPAQTVTTFRLSDETLTAESLRIVQQYLEEEYAPVVHLDLGSVQLPTASGLGALTDLNKTLRGRGGALVLLNVTAAAYEIFLLTRLVEVLSLSPWSSLVDPPAVSERMSVPTLRADER